MDVVTIDFETYYDDEYSLSKITTEEYIRSPEFEIIGVSVKVNGNEADWYSGADPSRFLKSINYSNKAILCHHTAFDGAILSWRFNIRPKFWLDTLSMSRPIYGLTVGGSLAALSNYLGTGTKGEEVIAAKGLRRHDFDPLRLAAYGAYCRNDCDLTYANYNILKKKVPVSELIVIDQTLRMFIDPVVELDRELLQEHLDAVRARKQELLSSVTGIHGDISVTLMSNQKFAKALENFNVYPPMKVSPTTGKATYAFAKTDAGMLALLEHPDERVQVLAAARLGTKSTIEETRTERLIGVSKRGTLPIMLNYYGAHTGRFSGGDKLNLQNLPKRGNNKIRQAIRAPDGWVFVAADAKQIEARIIAWLAGETELLEAFRLGRDIYREFAAEAFGIPLDQITKVQRFIGKTCILGLGYGMGWAKFQNTLRIGQGGMNAIIDDDDAQRIVRLYREKYWRVVKFWSKCGQALNDMANQGSGMLHDNILPYDEHGIVLPNGLKIQYPMIHKGMNGFRYCANPRTYAKIARQRITTGEVDDGAWSKVYNGMTAENITQALAGLAVKEYMAAVGQHYKMPFQVHDEIVLCVLMEQAAHARKHITAVMSTPPVWAPDLPVACEVGMAENYGDVEK